MVTVTLRASFQESSLASFWQYGLISRQYGLLLVDTSKDRALYRPLLFGKKVFTYDSDVSKQWYTPLNFWWGFGPGTALGGGGGGVRSASERGGGGGGGIGGGRRLGFGFASLCFGEEVCLGPRGFPFGLAEFARGAGGVTGGGGGGGVVILLLNVGGGSAAARAGSAAAAAAARVGGDGGGGGGGSWCGGSGGGGRGNG